jgi:hypothetical protein
LDIWVRHPPESTSHSFSPPFVERIRILSVSPKPRNYPIEKFSTARLRNRTEFFILPRFSIFPESTDVLGVTTCQDASHLGKCRMRKSARFILHICTFTARLDEM